jgi:hypothetical protein
MGVVEVSPTFTLVTVPVVNATHVPLAVSASPAEHPLNNPTMSLAAAVVNPLPLPLIGPERLVETTSVPAVVTGVPVTEKPVGMARPTLVTVPDPPPGGVVQAPAPFKYVLELQLPDHAGITSVDAMARSPTCPVDPFGVARNMLAACPEAKESPKVPALVMGVPLTENTEGAVSATLVTLPVPTEWQFPSAPR